MIKIIAGTETWQDEFGTFLPNYKANGGDYLNYLFDVEESIYAISSDAAPIISNNVLLAQKKYIFPSYESLNGFAVGQNVVLTKTPSVGAPTTVTTTIVSIDYNLLIIEFAALLGAGNLLTYNSTEILEVWSTDMRKTLYLNTNFSNGNTTALYDTVLSTSINPNLGLRNSLIDGSFSRNGADLSGIIVTGTTFLTSIGFISGQVALAVFVERLPDINTYTRSWRFTIENYNIAPLIPQNFDGTNSTFINYYFDFEWYSAAVETNPTIVGWNTSPTDTGRFDRAFRNDTPDSVLTSNTNNDIYYNDESTNIITITSASPDISVGGCYFPTNDSYYKNKYFSQEQLCMFVRSNGPIAVGVYPSISSPTGEQWEIEIVSLTYALGVHTVEFKVRPTNPSFTNFFTNNGDNRFLIWFKVGNVCHSVFDGGLVKAPKQIFDIAPFLIPLSEVTFIIDEPTSSFNATLITEGVKCSIEDDLQLEMVVRLPNNLTYQSVKHEVIVAERLDLDNYFVLETILFDLTSVPTLGNGNLIPSFTSTLYNNANMPTTSSFDVSRLSRLNGIFDIAGFFALGIEYSFLVNWKYWQQQLNAFVLFDPNRNNNWINYEDATYQLFVKTTIECEERLFVHHAPIHKILDYGEIYLDLVPPGIAWGGTITAEYYLEDGTQIFNLIKNEIIRLKFIVTSTDATLVNTDLFWGQVTIEPFESSPRWVISSNYDIDNNPNNPFLPLIGETRLKKTFNSATSQEFECLIDTNKLDLGNYKITNKFYCYSAAITLTQETRQKFDVKITQRPAIIPASFVTGGLDDCCEYFNVFADLSSDLLYKNDINTAFYVLNGGGDTIDFELYKDDVLTAHQPVSFTFFNQSDAKYGVVEWKQVLINDGIGCYELRLKYTDAFAVETVTTWAKYELNEWSIDKVQGFVNIRGYFNSNQLINGIDFTNSNVQDSINVPSFFGKRDPKTEVDNLVYSNRLTSKVTRENVNEYVLETNPLTNIYSRKLLDFYFLSETNLFITDNNYFNHEVYQLKRVIVKEIQSPEYYPLSNKAKLIVKFEDKIKNDKSFY